MAKAVRNGNRVSFVMDEEEEKISRQVDADFAAKTDVGALMEETQQQYNRIHQNTNSDTYADRDSRISLQKDLYAYESNLRRLNALGYDMSDAIRGVPEIQKAVSARTRLFTQFDDEADYNGWKKFGQMSDAEQTKAYDSLQKEAGFYALHGDTEKQSEIETDLKWLRRRGSNGVQAAIRLQGYRDNQTRLADAQKQMEALQRQIDDIENDDTFGAYHPEYSDLKKQRDELQKQIESMQAEMNRYVYGHAYQDEEGNDHWISLTQDEAYQLSLKPDFESVSANRDFNNPTQEQLQSYDSNSANNSARISDTLTAGGYYDEEGNLHDITGSIVPTNTEEYPVNDKLGIYLSAGEEGLTEAYNILNASNGNTQNTWANIVQEGDANGWGELTDTEIAIYYYLLNEVNQESAYKYLDDMTTELTYRETKKRADAINEADGLEKLAYNIASVPASVFGGIPAFIEDTARTIQGKEINPYSRAHALQNSASAIRESTAHDINEATGNASILGITLGDVYQAGMSGIDSVVGGLTLGGIGYGVSMGTGAASSEAKELFERGASREQIMWGSALAGTAEGIFEKISIDHFLKLKSAKNIGQAVKNFLLQGVVEGSEEINTEIANTITDALVMGSQSEFQLSIQKYLDEGKTQAEAEALALMDVGKNVWKAGVGGFISGSGMGGVSSISSYAGYQSEMLNQGQQIMDSGQYDAVKALALDMAQNSEYGKPGTKLGKYANKVDAKINQENESTDRNISKSATRMAGKLYDRADTLRQQQNTADIQSALQDNGLGKREAKKAAEIIGTAIESGDFSSKDVLNLMSRDDVAEAVTNVLGDEKSGINRRNLNYNLAMRGYKLNDEGKVVPITGESDENTSDQKEAATISNAEANKEDIVEISDGVRGKVNGIKYENGVLNASVTTESGETVSVPVEDVSMSREQEDLVAVSKQFGEDAPAVYAAYQSGIGVAEYGAAMKLARDYGYTGVSMSYAESSEGLSALHPSQIKIAYESGASAWAKKSEQTMRKQKNGTVFANRKPGKVSMKGGTVNGVTYKAVDMNGLTAQQKAAVRNITRLAQVTGINFVFFQSEKGAKGQYTGANGIFNGNTIFLDINAGATDSVTQAAILRTAAHELTHFIERFSESEYRAIQDFFLQNLEAYKGNTIDMLVAEKQARSKEPLSFDKAVSEIVADGCEMMLKDTKIMELLASEHESIAKKISRWLKNWVADLKAAFTGVDASHAEARVMMEHAEKLQEMWDNALMQALRNREQNVETVKSGDNNQTATEQIGAAIDADTESVVPTMMSERTWTSSDYVQSRDEAAKEISKAIGVSVTKAKAYIDDINSIAKMIADDRTRLDYFSSPMRSSFVSNVEYGGSFDFSTLCKKRRLLTGTFTAIQRALPNTALTANEILEIRNRMKDAGLEVSCGLCYVEGSRANMGQFAKEFLKLYKQYYPDAWQPNMADVNTPDGIEWVRINHPECYEQYEYFWNHYGTLKAGDKNLFASQQKPKLYQLHTEYNGEVLLHFKGDAKVEEKNRNGGIRLQSFSDFEIVHLIDTMQIIMDMSRVGLAGQAYTKVPDFAWALGDTGLKINLSLIAKGVDENGKLIFDDVEGMPISSAMELRDRYSANVGTILVVFNDQQLIAAMSDDRVDFIIPFHRSQWKKSQYEAMGLPAKTNDYTYMQNEKFIKPQYHEYRGRMVKDKATNYMPNEYWDFSKSGKENAVSYLEMCAKNNKRPKFYKLLQNNGDGSYSLKPDGSTDGYWKLLIDFKMYDNSGNGSPQMPVKPVFNMEEAKRMLNDYSGGHSNFPVAQGIVDSFVSEYKEKHKGFQYSDRLSEKQNEAVKLFGTTTDFNEAGYILPDGSMIRLTDDAHKGSRTYDHRAIGMVYGVDVDLNKNHGFNMESGRYMNMFVEDGGIRFDPGSPEYDMDAGMQLSKNKPITKAQERAIRDFIEWKKDRDEQYTPKDDISKYFGAQEPVSLNIEFGGGSDIAVGARSNDLSAWGVDHISYEGGQVNADRVISDIRHYYATGETRKPSAVAMFHYSDRDTDGNALSSEQQKFFADSKARDKNGNLKVLFHGTTSGGFTVFDPKFSDDGISLFASDNINMSATYAGSTGNVVLPKSKPKILRWTERNTSSGNGQTGVYKVYFNLTNPLIVDGRGQNWDRVSLGEYDDVTFRVTQASGNSRYDSPVNVEITTNGRKRITTYESVQDMRSAIERVYGRSIASTLNHMTAKAVSSGDVNVEYNVHFDPKTKREAATYTTRELAAQAKKDGYDGVILTNIMDSGKYGKRSDAERGSVYIAFSSEQVKSVDNKKPTKNRDIRYSDRDSVGNKLSAGQQEYFKDSVVRVDEDGDILDYGTDGYLLPVYHTTNADFHTFMKKYVGKATSENGRDPYLNATAYVGFWFNTQDLSKTGGIPGSHSMKVYLDCNRLYYAGSVEGLANDIWNNAGNTKSPKVAANNFVNMLKFDGYDGIILQDEEFGGTSFVVFESNQAKSVNNLNPTSKRDTRKSERDSDAVSNRSLLANALESAAQNETERARLAEYRGKIDMLNAEEQKLSELRAEIKDISFAKGTKDTKRIKSLQFEANQTANRINTIDRQLLRLEAAKPLQNVLQREKQMAYKRAEQKGKEALAAYREKAVNTQREIINRYQESRAKGIDSRKRTAMKAKIKDIVNELNQYLLKGNKEKRVMIGMKKAVAEALDAINMDTVGAEERIAKLQQEMLKATTPEKIQEIAKKIANVQEMGDNMSRRLESLKEAYAEIKNSDDPLIANAHDEVIEKKLKSVIESVGDTPLRDMTLSQLKDVYDMYKMVLTNIRNANKAFKAAKNQSIAVLGNNVMMEIEAAGGRKKYSLPGAKNIGKFDWNNLKPVYAFERIGSKTFTELFNNVRAGEDTWARDVSDAKEFSDDVKNKYGYKKWNFDQTYTFRSSSGMDFNLNLEQIMSLYAYSKRDNSKDHLKKGGIVFDPKTQVVVKTKAGIKVKYNLNEATSYNISDETLADIISKLTPAQKSFVDEMQDYLSTTMSEKGNEVSLEMYGIKLFNEKFYFPLKSAPQFMAKAKEQQQGDVKIKNSGFTKETVPKASNPIVLSGFMDVWASHVNEMSMYHAFVLPMEDFYRVYNYGTPTSETMATESVDMFLQNAYGIGATQYIDQLLKDLNGGARSDPRESAGKALVGRFKKAAVFASASVVIQQPSAVGRALALINPIYFDFNPKLIQHNKLWNEVKKYAPVAIIKEMGYFDTDMGMSTVDYIKGEKNLMDRMDEVLSWAPGYADELTWCHIWTAVKRETHAKNKGLSINSEEFLKKCGERFTEVIVKTQVYDSVLSRSANMRSKSLYMNMITSFMSEPTTSINMLQSTIWNLKRGNKAQAAKTFGSVMASVILNSLLVSLVYSARDDDEDETWLEKYFSSLATELLEGFNPVTYIPIAKDVLSLLQGYDVERADMTLISTVTDALTKLVKTVSVDTSDMDEEALEEHGKQVTDAAWSLVDAVMSLTGIPVKNVRRDVMAAINTYKTVNNGLSNNKTSFWNEIAESVKNSIPVWGWLPDKKKGDKLYDAIVSGDKAYQERVEALYDDQNSIDSARVKALRGNDPRILEAATAAFNGDPGERVRITLEIVAEGHFSRDDVIRAINAEITKLEINANGGSEPEKSSPKLYDMDDYYDAVMIGDKSTADDAKEYYLSDRIANGDSEEDALSSFKSSFTSTVKDEYLDGNIGKDKAMSLLKTYGGSSESEAETYLKKWDFEDKYGYSWDQRDNAYRLGDITMDELVDYTVAIDGDAESAAKFLYEEQEIDAGTAADMLVTYSGMKADDAKNKVAKWEFKNEYGFSYEDRSDAYIAGAISASDLKKSLMDLGGMTSDEADEKIAVYDWRKRNPGSSLDYDGIAAYISPIEGIGYSIEEYGVSPEAFAEYRKQASACKGVDADGDGKTDRGSKKAQIMAVINSLPISNEQKTALYFLNGWVASTIDEAPWY